MKGFAIAASLLIVSAAPAFAQQQQQQPPPQQQQVPAKPPAQTPAPAAPAAAPVPPAVFPQGAKVAFVDFQRIANESAEGKISTTKLQTLMQKKQAEGADRAKQLQANQQKLQTSGSMMNEAARTQLEKEIERQQVDGQRFQQDAQAEVQELQNELQAEFQKKLIPVLQAILQEKGLQLILSRADAGIVVFDPGLDLSAEVVKRLDAGTLKPSATPKP